MRTFVTSASPASLAALAGVAWRAPTPECKVTFGSWQGRLVGIEPCGAAHFAVHVDDEACELSLLSYLENKAAFGAIAWLEQTSINPSHISGGDVAEKIDTAHGVTVGALGELTHLTKVEAKALIAMQIEEPEMIEGIGVKL